MKVAGHMTGLRAALLCMGLVACGPDGSNAGPERDRTLGFVLANYDYAFEKAEEKSACPSGFVLTNEEQWEAQFPSAQARKGHLAQCLLQGNRGPGCESVWSNPAATRDPVAYRSVRSPTGQGLNLDGTEDGRATAKTCTHEKFTSPDGKTRVDNQYFRLLGCDKFIRSDVYSDTAAKERTAQYLINRLLLEVREVDDLKNDDRVEVVLYRGMDPLAVDSAGDAVPWQSQRSDPGIPAVRLKGRIEDGVLVTEPSDVFFEGLFHERRQLIHEMRLRLKIDRSTAEGLRVGYVDVPRLWESYSRAARWGGLTYGASPPSAYHAMQTLADGVKDPRTGQCSGLSSARGYKFVRAYIIHADERRS